MHDRLTVPCIALISLANHISLDCLALSSQRLLHTNTVVRGDFLGKEVTDLSHFRVSFLLVHRLTGLFEELKDVKVHGGATITPLLPLYTRKYLICL